MLIGVIITLIGLSSYFAWSEKYNEQILSSNSENSKTYINNIFGFSITYPENWVSHENPYATSPGSTKEMPDNQSSRVFIAPKNPEKLCNLLPVSPARYLDIREEEGSLNAVRSRLNSKSSGQDYQESTMVLGEKEVFVYTSTHEHVPCKDGSVQKFATILISNEGKVFSITTDLYNSPEVKNAISTLKFTK